MTKTTSSSQIVTSISDFEQLILVCKKHNISALKLGDIEFQVPADIKKEAEITRSEPQPDVNAIAFDLYRNM